VIKRLARAFDQFWCNHNLIPDKNTWELARRRNPATTLIAGWNWRPGFFQIETKPGVFAPHLNSQGDKALIQPCLRRPATSTALTPLTFLSIVFALLQFQVGTERSKSASAKNRFQAAQAAIAATSVHARFRSSR
jgi:hypothetical protein